MNKKTKYLLASIAVIGLVLITFGIQQTQLTAYFGTIYDNYDFNINLKTLTYSDINNLDLRGASFKDKHTLNKQTGIKENTNFNIGVDNKKFFKLYLELNNIDSSMFSEYNGNIIGGVFKPNTFGNLNYKDELEEIGFIYTDKTTYKAAYVGNYQAVCGFNCPECQTYGCDKYSNKCCQQFESAIIDKQQDYYSGNYDLNKILPMLSNCYVEGTINKLSSDSIYLKEDKISSYDYDYKIYGETIIEDNSFVCKVDKSKLFNGLPQTFNLNGEERNTAGAGISNGIVVFGNFEVPECSGSESYCEGLNLFECENNNFVNRGEIIGKCGVKEEINETTNTETNVVDNKTDIIENKTVDLFVECVANVDCMTICGNDLPTCVEGFCQCSGKTPQVKEQDETNLIIYLLPIPILIFVLLIYLFKKKNKKLKRRKKR